MNELAKWDSFYVIVGSAAGALIGLQFVVLTLTAQRTRPRTPRVGAAFATPTIVHFSAVLLLAALLRAPWPSVSLAAAVWGLLGAAGIAYVLIVCRHIRKQSLYAPVFEDWLVHVALPLCAYIMVVLSGVFALSHEGGALFGIAAAVLVLLFSAVHNAWDAVAYHVFGSGSEPAGQRPGDQSADGQT